MSDLEELGYLEQPHTSAGRIPSAKGYRLYVDSMLSRQPVPLQDAEKLKCYGNVPMDQRVNSF